MRRRAKKASFHLVVFMGGATQSRSAAFVFPFLILSTFLFASEEAWLAARTGSVPSTDCRSDVGKIPTTSAEPPLWITGETIRLSTDSRRSPVIEARLDSKAQRLQNFWQMVVTLESQKFVPRSSPIETYHNHLEPKAARQISGQFQLLLFSSDAERQSFLQRSIEPPELADLRVGENFGSLFRYAPLRKSLSRRARFIEVFQSIESMIEAPSESLDNRLRMFSETARSSGYKKALELPMWMRIDVAKNLGVSYEGYRKAREDSVQAGLVEATEALIHRALQDLGGESRANKDITLRILWLPTPIDSPPVVFFQGSSRVENDLTHNEMLELIALQFPNAWIDTGYLLNFVRAGIITLYFDELGQLENFEVPHYLALASHFHVGSDLIRVESSKAERDALALQLFMNWDHLRGVD